MTTTKLPFHEWIIITLFCAILLMLTGMALARQTTKPSVHQFELFEEVPKEKVLVYIKGAVKYDGQYELPNGSIMQDLLSEAEALPNADLSKVKLKSRLKDNQKITIPKKVWITIQIEGAIEKSGSYKVLSGTRCQELVETIEFPEEADLNSLKKKRHYLKDGELVYVSFKEKKLESKSKKKNGKQVK